MASRESTRTGAADAPIDLTKDDDVTATAQPGSIGPVRLPSLLQQTIQPATPAIG